MIYTSGSTGRPKGVLGRAGGLAGLLAHHRQTAAEVADRVPDGVLRVAHTYSFAFDASIDQLLWLLGGHELHLYDTELTKDAEELLAAYARDRHRRRRHDAVDGRAARGGGPAHRRAPAVAADPRRRGHPARALAARRRLRRRRPQHVRPDRGRGRRHRRPGHHGRPDHRPRPARHAHLRARRGPAAGAARCRRRALPGRAAPGAGLPGASRDDRRAVRRGPVRPGRRADVPHR